MDRGLYAAASSMLVQQGAMDAAATNTANVNTVGYRRAIPLARGFHMTFAAEIARSPGRVTGPVHGGGANLDATYTDTTQGTLRPTGRALDVALDGPGFMAVQTPAGVRYTRAGNFELNGRGELVTQHGHPVLGQGGPILIDGSTVHVDTGGTVLVDGGEVDRLQVVTFPDAQQLVRLGGSLYQAPAAVEAQRLDATETRVLGGHLEVPNLNIVEEMVRMIDLQRAFEMAARTVRVVDRTLGVAVQDIAGPG